LSDEIIEIEVVNWDKHQPKRKDVKHASWFALKHNIFDDPVIASLTDSEFKVFIGLLTLCSKLSQSCIRLSPRLLSSSIGCRTQFVHSCISKLEKYQMVRIVSRNVYGTLEDTRGYDTRGHDKRVSGTNGDGTQTTFDATEIKTPRSKTAPPESTILWAIYQAEYQARWQKEPPPRNARINSNLKKLVSEFGVESSTAMIKHFFKMPDAYYLKNFHPVGLLISQAHQIYASMTTGRTMSKGMMRSMETANTLQETFAAIDRGEV
jgi:hypothetical protein